MKKKGGLSTIRGRLTLGYLFVIFLSLGIILLLTTRIIRNYLIEQRWREMESSVNVMADSVAYDLSQHNSDKLYESAVQYAGQYEGHMLILDNNGVVQIDSSSTLNGKRLKNQAVIDVLWQGQTRTHMNQKFTPTEEAIGNGFSNWWNEWFPKESTTVYYVQAIEYNNETIGAVFFSAQIQDVLDRIDILVQQITLVMLITMGISVIFSIFLAGSVTKPIVELTSVIKRMSRGELNQRVKLSGSRELVDLGKTFNDMSTKLEQMDNVRNDFVSSASHEIKTPLATMKILVETLLYQEQMDEGMTREFLGDIDSEINRLNAVITDLLRLVQADKMGEEMKSNFERIDIKDICSDTLKRLHPIAQKRDIDLQADLNSAKLMGNSVQLTQAIFNLVDNAIKYTNDGGSVFIFCGVQDRQCMFIVKDTGIGIPEEDLSKIFERFYRVDKARARTTGGTGLGLAIVERMVKMHGGTIDVSSEENIGTTFVVTFPLI